MPIFREKIMLFKIFQEGDKDWHRVVQQIELEEDPDFVPDEEEEEAEVEEEEEGSEVVVMETNEAGKMKKRKVA
jgi:hypothetical protein